LPDVIWINLSLFALGLWIIIRGSDLFLDSAVWIAQAAGISQMIIGATIVSVCTTLPEFVASATASLKGAADMAVGNALGSVICNTGLILGVTLLFVTARILREVFLIKGIFMVGAVLMTFFLLISNAGAVGSFGVSSAGGGVLLVLLIVFLVVNYYESLHGAEAPAVEVKAPERRPTPADWLHHAAIFLAGAVLLTVGAYLLIEYGQRMARNFGISEAIISLAFIALGTSLPELFTAISAIRKKATNISVGNIFGANVLNMTMVVGSSAVIRPLRVQDPLLVRCDIPVAAALCTVAFGSGLFKGRIGKKTGAILLLGYVLYLVGLVVRGSLQAG